VVACVPPRLDLSILRNSASETLHKCSRHTSIHGFMVCTGGVLLSQAKQGIRLTQQHGRSSNIERDQPAVELQLYTCLPIVKSGNFSQSEEAWADLAASGFRSSINMVRVSAEGSPRELESLVCLHEEPFSSPVVSAQLQLFRAAHDNGVRLMLSGQGGDSMFASSIRTTCSGQCCRKGDWEATALNATN
jgi:hypothetical protein